MQIVRVIRYWFIFLKRNVGAAGAEDPRTSTNNLHIFFFELQILHLLNIVLDC